MAKHNQKHIGIVMIAGIFLVLSFQAKEWTECADIDERNPYKDRSEDKSRSVYRATFYERIGKRGMDKILSFAGLTVLAPVYAAISLAVYLDDPGPVVFTQKRVGKNRRLFYLHKFRSMKISAPHDVPTHQFADPENYVTRIGRILRKTSLDELPQLWDVFRGRMSVIGPRPALWNQEDLVAEREKYGANDILPGITGWAQINGRDELEIVDKAKLDGEYCEYLRLGGWKAFSFDMKCLLCTIKPVLVADGIAEGNAYQMHRKKLE